MSNQDRLRFGTGGIPIAAKGMKTHDGVKTIRDLGLEAMELEFVHSVNLNPITAEAVNVQRQASDVMLTCHGSYYINLNSSEKEKVAASRMRIMQGANMARLAGAWSYTFHSAFYKGMPEEKVYPTVKTQIQSIIKELRDNGNDIWIRPETTGKPVQWAGLKEILKLSSEVEGVMPCVDFAHMHARTGGKNNTIPEFQEMLTMIEKTLGREGLNNMHIHMSGIEYGEKGEKNHLFLEDSDLNWKDLLKVWKEYKIKGVVICESPNLEDDARLMQKHWQKL
ncbi:MAG TPA: TIM barrel protein [Alphaproteobacteria bacterium]|nr:TIM barrel protein [Alphaproteobacteria bacterium]